MSMVHKETGAQCPLSNMVKAVNMFTKTVQTRPLAFVWAYFGCVLCMYVIWCIVSHQVYNTELTKTVDLIDNCVADESKIPNESKRVQMSTIESK